jgi:hypothetical protein
MMPAVKAAVEAGDELPIASRARSKAAVVLSIYFLQFIRWLLVGRRLDRTARTDLETVLDCMSPAARGRFYDGVDRVAELWCELWGTDGGGK